MSGPAASPSALVLIHGWGLDSRVWQGLLSPLHAYLGRDFPLICLDLPGYQGRPDLEDPIARSVDALLEQVPPGAVVAGWSLGGLLAQLMAVRDPARVARLALIATTPCFVRKKAWAHGQPAALLTAFAAAVDEDPAGVLPRFSALINQGDHQQRALARQLAPLAHPPLPATPALARGLAWLKDLDLRPLAPRIHQPTLVLHGDQDPLMPLGAGAWLADHLPQARRVTVPGAAHVPFLADPESTARALAELIQDGEPRP
ncbi:alpha/beta fold hydrolase [Azospira inquinata]|uniref:Alpha/beta fold hydrolase n=1 Tax=Azospira inquinata TaxID=2785627 RepID=A0A975SP36_9RHOO|nr:alpha/beta fold hydrolase [Azospira inquinata]QWT45319.1 alpha/beta fold hydrolase [Azospira inquinata]QWT49349.1 alpha/beta fold hydrolase [Azospira inquinata]